MRVMQESTFQKAFIKTLIEGCASNQTRNTDWRRLGHGLGKRLKIRIADLYSSLLHRSGLVQCDYRPAALAFILEHFEQFENSYRLLADDSSRALLVKLLAFKVLGPRHVKLPRNSPQFWEKYRSINHTYCRQKRTIAVWNQTWLLNRYELPAQHGVISLHAHPLTVLATCLLEQYAYRSSNAVVSAKPGDVVIDGGGCWGDTALYFADKAGERGRVLSFEFMPENIAVFKMNLGLNPRLAGTIELVPEALWNCSGKTLSFDSNGPGTRVGSESTRSESPNAVQTVTIDDYVVRQKLPRVDFIKLDIEGAELHALQGASQTIKSFKPRLAISVYHKEDDLLLIPAWLDALGVGYRFFLDHFTIHTEETVLFASAEPGVSMAPETEAMVRPGV